MTSNEFKFNNYFNKPKQKIKNYILGRKSKGSWENMVNDYSVYYDSVKYDLLKYFIKIMKYLKILLKANWKKKDIHKYSIDGYL